MMSLSNYRSSNYIPGHAPSVMSHKWLYYFVIPSKAESLAKKLLRPDFTGTRPEPCWFRARNDSVKIRMNVCPALCGTNVRDTTLGLIGWAFLFSQPLSLQLFFELI